MPAEPKKTSLPHDNKKPEEFKRQFLEELEELRSRGYTEEFPGISFWLKMEKCIAGVKNQRLHRNLATNYAEELYLTTQSQWKN